MDDFYPLSLFFDPYPFILLFLFYSFFLSIKICLYKKITFTIYPAFLISFLACLLSTSSFVNLKPFSTILRLSPNYLALSTILLSSISPAFYIWIIFFFFHLSNIFSLIPYLCNLSSRSFTYSLVKLSLLLTYLFLTLFL